MLNQNTPAIVGEAVAGRSATVKAELKELMSLVTDSTFDIAERLSEVKGGNYYGAWGYQTFNEFVEAELDMGERKAKYLIAIVDGAKQLGIPRSTYETVKITKLREIFTLDPAGTYFDEPMGEQRPMADAMKMLVDSANAMTLEEVRAAVQRAKGLVGEDEMVWNNIRVKRIVLENVIKPARELAKRRMGSQGRDENGDAIEYKDGAADEMIYAEFLADPANHMDGEEEQ